MDFGTVPKKYRPVPFWSLNEKLNCDETSEQVRMMDEAGLGGYFMHARGGLQSEYMGEEWFENIKTAIETGNESGMKPWAYDENGWPSGFGNGMVNGLGVEYQQKYLRMSDKEVSENLICKSGDSWFYYEVNPYYVDVLDKKVIAKFIEVAYEPYYDKFGNSFEGFFTDEPQISRKGIPWSFVFEEEYKKRYNEDITEHLEELFLNVGDFKNTRIKFWKMVTELFSESFLKQCGEWCNDKGLKLTGHMLLEESMMSQLTTNGACMPNYEYFHIPGMDWLCRDIRKCLTPMQVSSVAEQLGKKQVISETFAMCGHNVSLAEMKGIYEWQMVHGVNLLCQHLEGYSIRGIRKRDHPPAVYYQQPWWSEYKKFNDAMSRIGMILSEGKAEKKVLVIHPITTAWSMYDDNENHGIDELDAEMLSVLDVLERKHIMYHLGDEIIMERHARVEDGKLVIGEQKYDFVIDCLCIELLPNTNNLIDEFKTQGGKVVTAEELEADNITDNPEITYTKRICEGYTAHYFVNTSNESKCANINANGKMLDIYTGELLPFSGRHEFEAWGSLMIIDDGTPFVSADDTDGNIVKLGGAFKVVKPTENIMTMDKCDYYFDGELVEKNGYVLNICEKANELGREVHIRQDYHVMVEEVPDKIELVCETPEIFDICVNGVKVKNDVTGWVIDKSFKKIDVSKYLGKGENVISFDSDFKQDESVYESIRKARYFETEKNKLVYNMEIEAVYLIGDFAVLTDGEWTELDKKASRYNGDFVITRAGDEIKLKHIERQGYPFFCGKLTLEGEIDVNDGDILEFDMQGVGTITVEIGGISKTLIADRRIPLSEFKTSGREKIRLTVTNTLRNLLGPHHLEEGECYGVTPAAFYKEPCVWNGYNDSEWKWNDGYCFCEMSV